jgi:signal transduction histidine kinase/CheY-like chemotaxis protein
MRWLATMWWYLLALGLAQAEPVPAAAPMPVLAQVSAQVSGPAPTVGPALDLDLRFTPMMRQYGVQEGLPSSTVTALAQDQQKYLWIAGPRGLTRFNGRSFALWQTSPAIPNVDIETLFVDSKNRLWMTLSEKGVCVLSADRISLHCLNTQADPAHRLPGDSIFAIAETDAGIWLPTFGDGVGLVDKQSLRLVRTLQFPRPDIFAAAAVNNQLYALSYSGALMRLGPHAENAETLPTPLPGEGLALFAEPGALWIGLGKQASFARLPLSADGLPSGPVWIEKDAAARRVTGFTRRAGQVLASTEKGLLIIQAQAAGAQTQLLRGVPGARGALPDGLIMAVLSDHEGGVWIGSHDQGLGYWPASGDGKQWLLQGRGALPSAHVTDAAISDDGVLWVSMFNQGIAQIYSDGTLIELPVSRTATSANALPSAQVWVTRASPGAVWIGHQQGLTRLDLRTHVYRHWQPSTPSKMVDLIAPDVGPETRGGAWIAAGRSQVVHLDKALTKDFELPAQWGVGELEQLSLQSHTLWFAGSGGLKAWDLQRPQAPPRTITGEPVYAFAHCQKPNTLWLATADALLEASIDGATILRRTQRPRGQVVDIGGMHCSAAGDALYLTGPGGFWQLSRANMQLERLVPEAARTEFSDRPSQMHDGYVFVGSRLGLLRFDPRVLAATARPFPLQLRNCCQQPLQLLWRDAPLQLQLDALSFADPAGADVRVTVQVQGQAGAPPLRSFEAHQVKLEGLAPGDYEIKASASNSLRGSGQLMPLLLQVQAPPWQRWWGITLITLGAFGALYGINRMLTQRRLSALQQRGMRERALLLEQLANARTESLGYVSHEMRNLLNGVTGTAALLRTADSVQQNVLLARMDSASTALAALLDDALDYSLLVADKLQMNLAPFALDDALQSCLQLFQAQAAAKTLSLCADIEIEPAVRIGDALRVRQIVSNLLSNAVKFTASGSVTLHARNAKGGVCIQVQDSGEPIPQSAQEKIFAPYVRLQSAARGTGLGLAICQQLARSLGGALSLQISAHGNTFTLDLPLPAGEITPSKRLTPLPPLQILVVEDDAQNQALITELLQQGGHQVQCAADALAALALLHVGTFEVILLDLDLPMISGIETAALICSNSASTCPILALTGRADSATKAQCLAAGMQGLIAKPYRMELINAAIATALGINA